MRKNDLLKILFSLPVILLVFYYVPFLGIVMLIARRFVIGKSKYPLGIIFIAITTIIVIPKFIHYLCDLFKTNQLSFIEDILGSEIYPVLLSRCKLLFILGIIALVIEALSKKIKASAASSLKAYFKSMQEGENIFGEDNLITEEQTVDKKTSFVKCPSCGANNVIHGKTGKCAFCKSNLENK